MLQVAVSTLEVCRSLEELEKFIFCNCFAFAAGLCKEKDVSIFCSILVVFKRKHPY